MIKVSMNWCRKGVLGEARWRWQIGYVHLFLRLPYFALQTHAGLRFEMVRVSDLMSEMVWKMKRG